MLRRVVIVAFPGVQLLDVAGPLEVFTGATEAIAAGAAGRPHARAYAPIVVTVDGHGFHTSSGLALTPARALASVRGRIDTLVIAGGAGTRRAATDASIVRAIARAAKRARRVASVCTGAFVLAAAGLLDGRRATTHWAYCDQLAAAHPAIVVEHEPIFVRDGAVWTSAGVTAGMDLALAMVEADLGRDVAMLVARHLVLFVRRAGGQAQFSPQLAAQAAEHAPIRLVQRWLVDHPDAAADVPALARRAAMSVRNFSRVFRAEVGESPAAWVERVRVDAARRLLETTARSVEEVAGAAGFANPESLRRAFARGVGLSPREYRARFGATAASPGASP